MSHAPAGGIVHIAVEAMSVYAPHTAIHKRKVLYTGKKMEYDDVN